MKDDRTLNTNNNNIVQDMLQEMRHTILCAIQLGLKGQYGQ